jgi:uncharacterized membrane protein YdjX (TVP38/TMEM64 family)
MSNISKNPEVKDIKEAGPLPEGAARPPAKPRWLIWGLLLLALFVLAGSFIWAFSCRYLLWGQACYYWGFFTDEGFKDLLKDLVETAGPLGPVVFISVQVLQVVFAPIPGEATGFLGGLLFGVPLGMLYSTIGLTLGSVAAFLLGRWLEVHFVARVVDRETLKRFDFLMGRQGALVSFLLFLIPGFPKDYLCFILGLSHISLKLFIVMVTVGRLPGTLMLTLTGAKVYEGDYHFTLVVLGLCLILGGIMYRYREPLYEWLRRWDEHRNGNAAARK